MAKKNETLDSAGDKYPSAHPAVVNKQEVITNIRKSVEEARVKKDPSETPGSPEWSAKKQAKHRASQFPKQY